SVIAFSSQFSTSSWAATQATGAPNTFSYGDIPTAWSARNPNGPPNPEFITLGYATPVFASGVVVRETNANGFVTQIDVLDTSNVLHTVFTGTDPSQPSSRVDYHIDFATTPYLVKGVKVSVDPLADTNTWEEIDSVQLIGVRANSTFFATGPANTNLPLPPSGTGGSVGFGVYPPPANADTTVSNVTVSGRTTAVTDVKVSVQ